jgi:hypothetical protein
MLVEPKLFLHPRQSVGGHSAIVADMLTRSAELRWDPTLRP